MADEKTPQAQEGQSQDQGPQAQQAEAPAPKPQVGAQQSLTVNDAHLDRLAAQLHSELHTTHPASAAAGMPADSILSKLVSTLGLTAADVETLKTLGVAGGRLLLKIAISKLGLGAFGL